MEVEVKNSENGNMQQQQPDRKKIQDYVYRFCDFIGKGNFSKVFKGYHDITGKWLINK